MRATLRGAKHPVGSHLDGTAATQCPRCDRGKHRRCLRLNHCIARNPPGVNMQKIGVQRARAAGERAPQPLHYTRGRPNAPSLTRERAREGESMCVSVGYGTALAVGVVCGECLRCCHVRMHVRPRGNRRKVCICAWHDVICVMYATHT